MTGPAVWVFFYGSYMNRNVLREADLAPDRLEPARLPGFDIRVEPRANLVRSEEHSVYGVLGRATHEELGRLYAHARDVLGETYLPEAVLVEAAGRWQPALCYVCHDMEPRPPDPEYVERILAAAREHAFPAWYLDRVRRAGGGGRAAGTFESSHKPLGKG